MQHVPVPDAAHPDPIDLGVQGASDTAQQAHGKRGVLGGPLCRLSAAVRGVRCVLIRVP